MHHREFDIEYDRDHLLNLFQSKKDLLYKKSPSLSVIKTDIYEDVEVLRLANYFSSRLPLNNPSNYAVHQTELVSMHSSVPPYINPGNNGIIVFPLSGTMKIKFFDHKPRATDNNGRPLMPPRQLTDEMRKIVLPTFNYEIVISDKPTAINGLVVHNMELTENFEYFVCKIPMEIKWDHVLTI